MSKAFTRESDDVVETVLSRPASLMPSGVKNLMTPRGEKMLREKLRRLAAEPFSASTRQKMNEIRTSLQSAVIVEAPAPPWKQILFGATVTVRDRQKQEITYHLVGVDEADPEENYISWRSPMARALAKAKVGDRIHFQTPEGDQQLDIIGLRY
jgi:transcription elongation factor GreB